MILNTPLLLVAELRISGAIPTLTPSLHSIHASHPTFDVITSIVSFLWEYTTAVRDVAF